MSDNNKYIGLDPAQEDSIIEAADLIRNWHYKNAEAKWADTPDDQKERPWPRCHNLQCNRTLRCLELDKKSCEGFDF